MFDFRCYTCGATLGRGLPPISALSKAQFELGLGDLAEPIERIENRMRRQTLKGTRFADMSSGSFCSFCLIWIVEFPSAEKGLTCTFEQVHAAALDFDFRMVNMHAYCNRLMSLHEAERMYTSDEAKPMLDVMRSLLKDGIEYQMIDCWFPECTKQEKILFPEDQKGCEDHAYFLSCFQILRTERQIWEFNSMGHKEDCTCWSCNEIRWDNEAAEWEYMQDLIDEHSMGCHDEPVPDCPRCPVKENGN